MAFFNRPKNIHLKTAFHIARPSPLFKLFPALAVKRNSASNSTAQHAFTIQIVKLVMYVTHLYKQVKINLWIIVWHAPSRVKSTDYVNTVLVSLNNR